MVICNTYLSVPERIVSNRKRKDITKHKTKCGILKTKLQNMFCEGCSFFFINLFMLLQSHGKHLKRDSCTNIFMSHFFEV